MGSGAGPALAVRTGGPGKGGRKEPAVSGRVRQPVLGPRFPPLGEACGWLVGAPPGVDRGEGMGAESHPEPKVRLKEKRGGSRPAKRTDAG